MCKVKGVSLVESFQSPLTPTTNHHKVYVQIWHKTLAHNNFEFFNMPQTEATINLQLLHNCQFGNQSRASLLFELEFSFKVVAIIEQIF